MFLWELHFQGRTSFGLMDNNVTVMGDIFLSFSYADFFRLTDLFGQFFNDDEISLESLVKELGLSAFHMPTPFEQDNGGPMP